MSVQYIPSGCPECNSNLRVDVEGDHELITVFCHRCQVQYFRDYLPRLQSHAAVYNKVLELLITPKPVKD